MTNCINEVANLEVVTSGDEITEVVEVEDVWPGLLSAYELAKSLCLWQ